MNFKSIPLVLPYISLVVSVVALLIAYHKNIVLENRDRYDSVNFQLINRNGEDILLVKKSGEPLDDYSVDLKQIEVTRSPGSCYLVKDVSHSCYTFPSKSTNEIIAEIPYKYFTHCTSLVDLFPSLQSDTRIEKHNLILLRLSYADGTARHLQFVVDYDGINKSLPRKTDLFCQ